MTPDELYVAVRRFVGDAKAKAAGGLTVSEFGELTIALLRLSVEGLDSLPGDGASKKEWAIRAVELLFDSVADRCVPMVALPAWWVVRPAVRSLVLAAASGALEQVLQLSRAATGGKS